MFPGRQYHDPPPFFETILRRLLELKVDIKHSQPLVRIHMAAIRLLTAMMLLGIVVLDLNLSSKEPFSEGVDALPPSFVQQSAPCTLTHCIN